MRGSILDNHRDDWGNDKGYCFVLLFYLDCFVAYSLAKSNFKKTLMLPRAIAIDFSQNYTKMVC
ncbi:hypothetical protein AWQ21_04955 [Picosynechococcus sp. PCC 7003]|nr:hypothetical protein AWQ21_04955 [Picosynechococcus sp. PCC 7003]